MIKPYIGICLRFSGIANSHWTDSEYLDVSNDDSRSIRKTIHYRGKHVYLKTRTYLFGAPDALAIVIPGGTHTYEFSQQLPLNLASSMELKYGHIRYYMQVTLDAPWKCDQEFKLPFNVDRPCDLNEYPKLRPAVESEEIKNFCCCCCESDPLYMTVTIPHSGFVPGLNIPITITFINKSKTGIIRTIFSLIQTIRYRWCDNLF